MLAQNSKIIFRFRSLKSFRKCCHVIALDSPTSPKPIPFFRRIIQKPLFSHFRLATKKIKIKIKSHIHFRLFYVEIIQKSRKPLDDVHHMGLSRAHSSIQRLIPFANRNARVAQLVAMSSTRCQRVNLRMGNGHHVIVRCSGKIFNSISAWHLAVCCLGRATLLTSSVYIVECQTLKPLHKWDPNGCRG